MHKYFIDTDDGKLEVVLISVTGRQAVYHFLDDTRLRLIYYGEIKVESPDEACHED